MALKRVTDTQPLCKLFCYSEQGGVVACHEFVGESLGETALTADLGGSSN